MNDRFAFVDSFWDHGHWDCVQEFKVLVHPPNDKDMAKKQVCTPDGIEEEYLDLFDAWEYGAGFASVLYSRNLPDWWIK